MATQISEVREVEQKHYESLQIEATHRHELVLKDNATKHEELLQLLSHRVVPPIYTEQGPQAKHTSKRQIPRNGGQVEFPEYKDIKGRGLLPMPPKEMDPEEDRKARWGSKNFHSQHNPLSKLEFPSFGGEESRTWVENFENYFEIYQIPPSQWLSIASMHLTGRARTWKRSYFVRRQGVSWAEFTEALIGERYLVREFGNLKQVNSVERYQERFEELRTHLLFFNPHLTEEHFISCYISGL